MIDIFRTLGDGKECVGVLRSFLTADLAGYKPEPRQPVVRRPDPNGSLKRAKGEAERFLGGFEAQMKALSALYEDQRKNPRRQGEFAQKAAGLAEELLELLCRLIADQTENMRELFEVVERIKTARQAGTGLKTAVAGLESLRKALCVYNRGPDTLETILVLAELSDKLRDIAPNAPEPEAGASNPTSL